MVFLPKQLVSRSWQFKPISLVVSRRVLCTRSRFNLTNRNEVSPKLLGNRYCLSRSNQHIYGTLRVLSSLPERNSKPKDETGFVPQLLNKNFERYPFESIAALMVMEISSIYGAHFLIVQSGVHIPVEFGLAFAMSRPFRRFRLPLELACASLLTKVAPQVSQVKLSNLATGLPQKLKDWFNSGERTKMRQVQSMIDRYGLAYFISARWLGASIVLALNASLHFGVDVNPLLEAVGATSLAPTLSSWAAAVTASSVLYPVSIAASGLLSPAIAHTVSPIVRKVYGKVSSSR